MREDTSYKIKNECSFKIAILLRIRIFFSSVFNLKKVKKYKFQLFIHFDNFKLKILLLKWKIIEIK